MRIYSLTEARKILGDLVNQVRYGKEIIALGKHGKAEVFLVAFNAEKKEELPMTELNSASESFRFLKEEPDLYTREDLKERYV